jgi:hypothetical protein
MTFLLKLSLGMRAIYLLIFIFLAWCVICARWYMFSVKGLNIDPTQFDPHENTVAIVEILFMVLVAFLLGFAIAWILRETILKEKYRQIRNLQSEKSSLEGKSREQKGMLEKNQNELIQLREEFLDTARLNEKLKSELESKIKEVFPLENELMILRPNIQQSDAEVNLLKFRLTQAEQRLTEMNESNLKLINELGECRSQGRYERKEPIFSDFISDQLLVGIVQKDEFMRDDLKLIVGIGPIIERKLNRLGIYTFKQISELTEISSKPIVDAIKFFPGRIKRDKWVQQASRLYRNTLKQ